MSDAPDVTDSADWSGQADEGIRFLGRVLGRVLHAQEGGLARRRRERF